MKLEISPPEEVDGGFLHTATFSSEAVLPIKALHPLEAKTYDLPGLDPEDLGVDSFRPLQEEAIFLAQVLAKATPKSRIYLSAPTGSGKSIIARGFVKGFDPVEMPGLILTADHQLQDQYAALGIPSITGKPNWPCLLDTTRTVDKADCSKGLFKPQGCDMFSVCPYYVQRGQGWDADVCVTNYHYLLTAGGSIPKRVVVADEAHHLEAILRALQTVTLDLRVKDEVQPAVDFTMKVQLIREQLKGELASLDGASDLEKLQRTVYEEKVDRCDRVLALIKRYGPLARVMKAERSARAQFFTPIGGMSYLRHKTPILAMSATLCDPFLLEKLDAERSSTADEDVNVYLVEVPSCFPPANRPIYPLNTVKVGRKMTEIDMRQLVWTIDRLLERHGDQKGVIHTVSYDLARQIKEMSDYPSLLIDHPSGGRDRAIEEFKAAPPGRVLLSPAAATGVDLPYDLCRWQVIAKLPFPYMGDKMVKVRMEEFPQLSNLDTAQTVVQMAGRGMRAADDHCETYILDANWRWFYGANWALFPHWFRQAVVKREL